jgi:hypothetical protein
MFQPHWAIFRLHSFFKESIALYTLSLVLLSMPLYIYFWCYKVSLLPVLCIALYLLVQTGTENTEPTQHTHNQEAENLMVHRAAMIQKTFVWLL